MNSIRNSPWGVALVLVIVLCVSGCKSQKKAREAAASKAKLEQEMALRKQREAEELKRAEADERARQLDEEARRLRESQSKAEVVTHEMKLEKYFASISSAASVTSANSSISEALTLFATPEVPVLIVISEAAGQKDYDRPTTIGEYLNYLKDQKKNINSISALKVDDAGKITEVELKKNH